MVNARSVVLTLRGLDITVQVDSLIEDYRVFPVVPCAHLHRVTVIVHVRRLGFIFCIDLVWRLFVSHGDGWRVSCLGISQVL